MGSEGEVNQMEENRVRIRVSASHYMPEFEIIISVPEDDDTVEYIDEFMFMLLNRHPQYKPKWDFVKVRPVL